MSWIVANGSSHSQTGNSSAEQNAIPTQPNTHRNSGATAASDEPPASAWATIHTQPMRPMARRSTSRRSGRDADEPPVDDLGRPDIAREDEQERERDRDRRPHEIDGQRQRALVDGRQAVGAGDRRERRAARRGRARRRSRAAEGAGQRGHARDAALGRRRAQAAPAGAAGPAIVRRFGRGAGRGRRRRRRSRGPRRSAAGRRCRRTPRASCRRSGTARARRSASRPGWPMAMRTPTRCGLGRARVSGTGSATAASTVNVRRPRSTWPSSATAVQRIT